MPGSGGTHSSTTASAASATSTASATPAAATAATASTAAADTSTTTTTTPTTTPTPPTATTTTATAPATSTSAPAPLAPASAAAPTRVDLKPPRSAVAAEATEGKRGEGEHPSKIGSTTGSVGIETPHKGEGGERETTKTTVPAGTTKVQLGPPPAA
ncbi:unnamed protein product [Closterium sp. NIES-54]